MISYIDMKDSHWIRLFFTPNKKATKKILDILKNNNDNPYNNLIEGCSFTNIINIENTDEFIKPIADGNSTIEAYNTENKMIWENTILEQSNKDIIEMACILAEESAILINPNIKVYSVDDNNVSIYTNEFQKIFDERYDYYYEQLNKI